MENVRAKPGTTLFFASSRSITTRLAELFNFTWPTVAALWNLRWQVQGYSSVTGKIEVGELHERFVAGSGVTSANLKVACLETSWEQQKSQFAKFLLFDLCAMYEAWLEKVCFIAFSKSQAGDMVKLLQVPMSARNAAGAYNAAITLANSDRSAFLKNEFFPVVARHRKNTWATIEQLLTAYRYFKLVRNKIIHGGGITDQSCLNAAAALKAVAKEDLGFKRAPNIPVASIGEPIPLDLSDVAGLGNIVQRLIATFDAALCVSRKVESYVLEATLGASTNSKFSLSNVGPRRHQQVISLLKAAGLPSPNSTTETEAFLLANRVVRKGVPGRNLR